MNTLRLGNNVLALNPIIEPDSQGPCFTHSPPHSPTRAHDHFPGLKLILEDEQLRFLHI